VPLTCNFVPGTVEGVPRRHDHRPTRVPRNVGLRSRQPTAGAAIQGWPEPHRCTENKWRTIRYAVASNARTARLCVIMLVAGLPADVFLLLVRH
jgi:hypothetical protein